MWVAFTTGKDLGYSKGQLAGANAEYVNGVQDGVESCIDAVLNMIGNKDRVLRREEYSEETL